MMEQLILEVIIKRVEEKKVIRSSQHRFTKGKSCLTNLITFYDGTTGWVDEGRDVDVVYLDFRLLILSMGWAGLRLAPGEPITSCSGSSGSVGWMRGR